MFFRYRLLRSLINYACRNIPKNNSNKNLKSLNLGQNNDENIPGKLKLKEHKHKHKEIVNDSKL